MANREADLTDEAGAGVDVGELAAEDGEAQGEGAGGAEDEGGACEGDAGVGDGHHGRKQVTQTRVPLGE